MARCVWNDGAVTSSWLTGCRPVRAPFDDPDRLLPLTPLVQAVDGKIDALTLGQEELRSQLAELNSKVEQQHADATAKLDLVLGLLESTRASPTV